MKQIQWHLGSTGARVQSLAQHSGLRIQCCHSCGIGHKCSSDLIPSLGTPYADGQPKEKEKKNSHWNWFTFTFYKIPWHLASLWGEVLQSNFIETTAQMCFLDPDPRLLFLSLPFQLCQPSSYQDSCSVHVKERGKNYRKHRLWWYEMTVPHTWVIAAHRRENVTRQREGKPHCRHMPRESGLVPPSLMWQGGPGTHSRKRHLSNILLKLTWNIRTALGGDWLLQITYLMTILKLFPQSELK